ncbi:MAG: RNA polymerase sigma factor, partial [Saprospiraceae bacterium]|nr:RNA polymerase sigma factor [Saprospiraceae bacterium]
VFRKYVMEGYSHREIAEQLQLSEGTSKWLLSESRKNLKNWLSFIDSEYKYGQ